MCRNCLTARCRRVARDRSDSQHEQMLHALLLEVRELRQALARTGAIASDSSHESLLAGARGLFGDSAWTSRALLERAFRDRGAQTGALRQALAALRVCDPAALGFHLRRQVGRPVACGLELQRAGVEHGVMRWRVVPA